MRGCRGHFRPAGRALPSPPCHLPGLEGLTLRAEPGSPLISINSAVALFPASRVGALARVGVSVLSDWISPGMLFKLTCDWDSLTIFLVIFLIKNE